MVPIPTLHDWAVVLGFYAQALPYAVVGTIILLVVFSPFIYLELRKEHREEEVKLKALEALRDYYLHSK